MKILLASGAPLETWPQIERKYDLYIGVDRGSLFLLNLGFPLELAIGDFDSLSNEEKKFVLHQAKHVQTAPAEKDDTDSQLALAYIFEHYPDAEVTFVGATGGRIDHFLANLWMVLEPRFLPYCQQLTLKDKGNTICFLSPGIHEIKRENDMTYLAYCCLTPVDKLTLTESKYTLDNQNVSRPTSYASNEFVGNKAKISFTKGMVAVIQSKDS